LGDFFTNSSGHPACQRHARQTKKSDIGRYTLSRKKEMYHRKNVKTITGKEDRDIHIITKTDTKTDKFDFTTTYVHTYYFITAFWWHSIQLDILFCRCVFLFNKFRPQFKVANLLTTFSVNCRQNGDQ
jgi:hypothetical protein